MKTYTTIILITALVIFNLLLSSCNNKAAEPTSENSGDSSLITVTKNQFNLNEMVLGKLSEKSFPETVNTTGMIDVPPQNRASVNAFMGGFIKNTPLLVGDVVKKGQFLVSIENPEFLKLQQNYLEVNSQLPYLEMEYQRQKQLFDENITSQKNYMQAESNFRVAQASLNGLKKQLELLNFNIGQIEKGQISATSNIYAPISGTVSRLNVALGSFVSDAFEILEIIDTDHIHIELNVFERDIMKLKIGQSITFTIPEASNDIFQAQVHLVGAAIEPNRTIKVHGHLLDNENHNFLTGMFVEATIFGESSTKLALPDDAVVGLDNAFFVLQLEDSTEDNYQFNQLEVEVGASFQGYTTIKTPLSTTAQFLTKGAFALINN